MNDTITLDMDLADAPCPVRADIGQIEQILLNLVINARDAMPDGGSLTVATYRIQSSPAQRRSQSGIKAEQSIRIRISDNGTGMSDDVKQRIFEPFFTTKEEGKGTGLGLATVYGIVRQHGGHIEVDSTPGTGTVFTIDLPCCQSAVPLPKRHTETAVRGNGELIVAVEDNETIRALLNAIIPDHGYRIIIADSPQKALAEIADLRVPVDLLLTDVVMPGMNGFQLASALRPLHPDMKVLYMSGYAQNVISKQEFTDESFDLLQKPFSAHALTVKIREIIDRRAS